MPLPNPFPAIFNSNGFPASPPSEMALRRSRQTPILSDDNQWLFHQVVELDAQMGVGLTTGQGVEPLVELSWSDDSGQTWKGPRAKSVGALGKYRNRARWLSLGRARTRVYLWTLSDPVACAWLNAYLTVIEGLS